MVFAALAFASQPLPKLEGTLVVANQQSHTASLVSLKDGKVVAEFETGPGPHEAAVSPDGKRVIVTQYGDKSNLGNTLVLIDIPGAKILGKISTGEYIRPHGAAFLDSDTVIVTSEPTKKLVVVDLKERKVARTMSTDQPLTHLLSLPKDGKHVYAASVPVGIVTKFEAATGKKLGEATVGKGSEGIGVSPDGKWVVTANRNDQTLSIVDAEKLSVTKTIPAPGLPYRVAFTPDSRRFVVPNPGAGSLMLVSMDALDAPKSIRTEGAPGGIFIHPKGRYAFVTLLDKGEVAIFDLKEEKQITAIKVGASPDGIAYSPVPIGLK